jgi:DNA-dependent protein kinase catalytic subunit
VPDIQIKREDIVKPLLRLVLLDSSVAKAMVIQLVLSIGGDNADLEGRLAARLGPGQSFDAYKSRLREQIVVCLEQSGTSSADVVDALLGIAQNFGIILPASAVVNAGNRSSNFYTSIQVLERQALTSDSSCIISRQAGRARGHGGKKRPADDLVGGKLTFSDSDWHNLSRLYSRLEEHDIVRGLYEKFSKQNSTRNALHYELLGDFEKALEGYNQLRSKFDNGEFGQEEYTDLEVDLWDQGIRDCLEGLQSWDELSRWILDEMEIKSDILDAKSIQIWQPDRRKELGLYLRSLIGKAGKEAFQDKSAADTESGKLLSKMVIDNLLDASGKLESKRKALESDFIGESALGLLLDSKQLRESRFEIVKTGTDLVRKGFENFLEKWSYSESIGTVVKRKMLRSLQQLVEIEEFFQNSGSVQQPVEKWKEMLRNWEHRLPRREMDDSNQWSQILSCRLALLPNLRTLKAPDLLEQSVFTTYLTLSSLARRRGNFFVASSWIVKAEGICSKDNLDLYISKLKLDRKIGRAQASLLNLEYEDGWSRENPLDCARLLTLQGDILARNSLNGDEAYKKYCKAVDLVQPSQATGPVENAPKIGSIFMKYASFCNEQLEKSPSDRQLPKAVVENMLRAISLGNTKARAHFPRVLELASHSRDAGSVFMKSCESVPSQSILQWLPQIFAEMSCASKRNDKNFRDSVLPLLERVAAEFPQTVYLGLRVIKDDVAAGKGGPTFFDWEGLFPKIRFVFERFCRSLEHLQEPDQQLLDFLKEPNPANPAVYKQVYEDCLDCGNNLQGQARQIFAKLMHDKGIVKELGPGGKYLPKSDKDAASVKEKVDVAVKSQKPKPSRPQLIQYSPELANFEGGSLFGEQLVVPGQAYEGSSPTMEIDGVKVISYDPTLLVLSSLRKPKRLIMRGSDGKEYWWLVKNGEDLRQDERVEQVFRAMNHVLQGDPRCSQARLSIVTYSVVPISKSAGLIEWVQKTKPVADVLEGYDGFPQIRKVAEDKFKAMYKEVDDYRIALQKCNKNHLEDREASFAEICSGVPCVVMRSEILKLSSNAKVRSSCWNVFFVTDFVP